MNWVCYLLRCADDTYYCGITNHMEKRLAVHNAGEGAKYTRGRLPVSVAYRESCADKSAALKRELQIKRMRRSEKQALLQENCLKENSKI
ncbi:MAG TPA: GIY-YIG nuclease family protein [Gallionellaceae bacterium]|nr:GIY-YIG nuclease family protein [Gallionellaceae bacterium]